jgi:DNA-binding transcriptional regulator YdaS (Cro superfamily)
MTTQENEKRIAMNALDEAIAILKEKGLRLWRELGITRGALSQWRREDREIPSKHCKKIFVLTDERVTCDRLNPKVFGELERTN